MDRIGDRRADADRDILGQRAVEAGDRAEMVEQIGVSPADPRRDRLQGDRRDAFAGQQLARRRHRCRAAFALRQAFTIWQAY